MLTIEQFNLLYNENITKKEYDRIICLVNQRFVEICNHIYKIGPSSWFDYDNGNYKGKEGYFDPEEYRDYIGVIGECLTPIVSEYESSFPTCWLWESDFMKHIEREEKKKKQKEEKKKKTREENLKKKKLVIHNIKSKLTAEELKFVSFK